MHVGGTAGLLTGSKGQRGNDISGLLRDKGVLYADERSRTSTRYYPDRALNPARLPIPPRPREG